MIKAIRTQSDDLGDEYSLEAETPFEGERARDRARPEFAKETDINFIIDRVLKGADALGAKNPEFREVDQNLDLQGALMAVEEAKEAFRQMPEDLKRRYKTWQAFLTAVESGQLTIINREAPQPETPPAVPPA